MNGANVRKTGPSLEVPGAIEGSRPSVPGRAGQISSGASDRESMDDFMERTKDLSRSRRCGGSFRLPREANERAL